ncbi:LysR family transcriptional regulator [Herbaspirillum lusitanum]|uniref:LysR substrate-binding domain-containing protein n=1 Tax=Herbaspirillum lusitanum TaxID=213312 RepID=UPI0022375289|nr:LysR substrate-binding domain-containing protein [Herbaspirillum lusitanum]MCW5297721.1 LysR family transcriptional regulator [Herbaspirillum lusitanum]
MELRHLRYFVAVAEELSFTNAAEKVHVTQSTLSHQIKQLEDEVGCQLFHRIGRRIQITETGEAFLEHVQNALREVDEGMGIVRTAFDALSGEIRIGATQTFNMRLIPHCMALFFEKHTSVKVQVLELPGDEIASRLLTGELDIGVAYRPASLRSLRFEPLYNEEMTLLVGERHPFFRRRFVRMAELHRQKLVLLPHTFVTRAILEECFRTANAEPIVIAEMNAIAPMIELVSATEIAAIVSEHAVTRNDLRIVPLESPTPVRTPGLLWKREGSRNVAARYFASLIRSVAENENSRRQPIRRRKNRKIEK